MAPSPLRPLKCLFLIPNGSLSESQSGGSARFLTSYLGLKALGIELHVLRLLRKNVVDFIRQFEATPNTDAVTPGTDVASWQDFIYSGQSVQTPDDWSPVQAARGWITEWLRYARRLASDVGQLRPVLAATYDTVKPDFIWAETAPMAMLASEVIGPRRPWAYSHHDWHYKLTSIRRKSAGRPLDWRFRLQNWRLKGEEEAICRASHCVVTGSTLEKREIERAGQPNVFYLPTTYHTPPGTEGRAPNDVRIFHLGKISVTSNRLGLEAYLGRVHSRLTALLHERDLTAPLWVVGDCSAIPPDLAELLNRHDVAPKGYVSELGSVIRPFDLAVIPYEGNTGVRTKFSALLGLSAVVVSTSAAISGIPEARNGENCVIVESLDAFPEVLAGLAGDFERRQRLGRAARACFDAHFTLESQMPVFNRIIDLLCSGSFHPASRS